jgi:hypothetical protein
MDTGYPTRIPINLAKLPYIEKIKRLTSGEPWTIITKEPILFEDPDDEELTVTASVGTYFSKTFEDGVARTFRITAITVYNDGERAYETVFEGLTTTVEQRGETIFYVQPV